MSLLFLPLFQFKFPPVFQLDTKLKNWAIVTVCYLMRNLPLSLQVATILLRVVIVAHILRMFFRKKSMTSGVDKRESTFEKWDSI